MAGSQNRRHVALLRRVRDHQVNRDAGVDEYAATSTQLQQVEACIAGHQAAVARLRLERAGLRARRAELLRRVAATMGDDAETAAVLGVTVEEVAGARRRRRSR